MSRPRRPGDEQRVPADAAVGGRNDVAGPRAPGVDDPGHRFRREVGPVGEHDDGGLDLAAERSEPTAQRRPGPQRPVGAAHQRALVLNQHRRRAGTRLRPRRSRRRERARDGPAPRGGGAPASARRSATPRPRRGRPRRCRPSALGDGDGGDDDRLGRLLGGRVAELRRSRRRRPDPPSPRPRPRTRPAGRCRHR